MNQVKRSTQFIRKRKSMNTLIGGYENHQVRTYNASTKTMSKLPFHCTASFHIRLFVNRDIKSLVELQPANCVIINDKIEHKLEQFILSASFL